MAGKRHILCLDDSRYEISARKLRDITGVRDLGGDKLVFSDFEGAVPQIATVESGGKYAHAVLEKELRESGEIEAGGRVLVLLKRRRGQRTTELLYIATPPDVAVEKEIERDLGGHDYLLFPIQKLISKTLVELNPRRPTAMMLISERHVDVVVADRRILYGAFRVSALKTGANRELLERNLETALRGVEREYNIQVDRFYCETLLTPADVDYRWIHAVADARGIRCKFASTRKFTVHGSRSVSSVLRKFRRMKPAESSSPLPVIYNYRANEALPWVAVAMLVCCAIALYVLVDRQARIAEVENKVAALSSSLDARLDRTPVQIPRYRPYIETASRIDYARSIPTLRQVLGDISNAAQGNATEFSAMEAEYHDDRIVLTLTGHTEKEQGRDNMAHYNRLISQLRRMGYALAESELNTETRVIDFTARFERRVAGGRA